MHEPWTAACPEPASIEEAELRTDSLIADIEQIQQQLGDRRRMGTDTPDWRNKAGHALRIKRTQLRTMKTWLRHARGTEKSNHHYGLLRGLYGLVSRWAESGVADLTDEDEQLLTAVETILGDSKSPHAGASQ